MKESLRNFAEQNGISYANARQMKARSKIVTDGDSYKIVTIVTKDKSVTSRRHNLSQRKPKPRSIAELESIILDLQQRVSVIETQILLPIRPLPELDTFTTTGTIPERHWEPLDE